MIYRNENPRAVSGLGLWNDLNADGTCNSEEFFGKENFGFICEWETASDAKRVKLSGATVKLSSTSAAYTGKKIKPTVTVKVLGISLKKGTDFKVTYTNNKKIGTATVTIKGVGVYNGTIKTTFQIVPSKVKNVAASRTSVVTAKVYWKKFSAGDGYIVQYSTSSDFSTKLSKKITSSATTRTTLKKLKKNTVYYVRVRSYKTVNGKTLYGKWSKTKKISSN